MNFAIIAAGNGERLAREGLAVPKPMAEIAPGLTMLRRLLDIFTDCGAVCIRIIVNAHTPQLKEYVESLTDKYPLEIVCRSTSGSLESLMELLDGQPGRWIVTTADTVFPAALFVSMVEQFIEKTDADALMGLTPYIDDEKPLYATTDAAGRVTGYYDEKPADNDTVYASAGIYCLAPGALSLLGECRRRGFTRMRQYQKLLVDSGLTVDSFIYPQVIDVDHVSDIEKARQLFAQP